ncbi:MAG: ABC transporter permease [Bdellovibrionales bacterium]|nr:ABC transporter permease [Bdellovibrionales bacterium]
MLKFIIKRFAAAIPVLLVVTTLTFFLVRIAPGGPFDTEKAVSAEVMQALKRRYNLDQPVYVQYFDYMKNAIQGDLGPSFKYPGRTVTEMVKTGLPVTFELGVYAMIWALLIGVTAGVVASLRPNTAQDYVPMTMSMIGICLPSVLLGPLLVLVFGLWFEWLPVSGWDSWQHKILPSLTLGSGYAAYIARLSRGGMLEILSQDFIRTARAKGLSNTAVVFKHAMRGGLGPVISFIGPAIAGLLSGSFVTETVFQIQGIGRFYVQAAFNRDYTMILGTTVLFSVMIVFFNLLSDIMAVWANPRLKFETSKGAR